METNNDHKSPEQVTDDYYKALIVQNKALKQQNEELKGLLVELKSELKYDLEFEEPINSRIFYNKIETLLTKYNK